MLLFLNVLSRFWVIHSCCAAVKSEMVVAAKLNLCKLSAGTVKRKRYGELTCNCCAKANCPFPPTAAFVTSVGCVNVSVIDNLINPFNPADTLALCLTSPITKLFAFGAKLIHTPLSPTFCVLVIVAPLTSYPTAKFIYTESYGNPASVLVILKRSLM